jgi:hypothetical protein
VPLAATPARAPSPVTEDDVVRAVEAIPGRILPYMTTRSLDRSLGGFDVLRGTWTDAVEARLVARPGTLVAQDDQVSIQAELAVRRMDADRHVSNAEARVLVIFTPTAAGLGHPSIRMADGRAETDVTGDVDAFVLHLGKLGVLDLAPIRDALGQSLLDLGDWDVVDHATIVADRSTMRDDGPGYTIRARLRIVVVDGGDNQEVLEEDVVVTVVDPADWGGEISIEVVPPVC